MNHIASECSTSMDLPEDYEPCGTCNFDHSYEYAEAREVHLQLEKETDLPEKF